MARSTRAAILPIPTSTDAGAVHLRPPASDHRALSSNATVVPIEAVSALAFFRANCRNEPALGIE